VFQKGFALAVDKLDIDEERRSSEVRIDFEIAIIRCCCDLTGCRDWETAMLAEDDDDYSKMVWL
jgi:hypothetical protein